MTDEKKVGPKIAQDISTLRGILFDTLTSLKDEKNPMDINRAKAINDVAQTIINSAKVEVDHLKTMQGTAIGTNFIPIGEVDTVLGTGVTVTRHKLKG